VVSYCGQNPTSGNPELVTYDCATEFPSNPATCGTISTQYGVDCLVPTASPCYYTTMSGRPYYAFCGGATGACQLDVTPPDGGSPSACITGAAACTPPADGGFAPVCHGADSVAVACHVNQPIEFKCPAGGTCTNGNCTGPVGANCSRDGLPFKCNSGLNCAYTDVDAGVGKCQ
jgi:hypothetical protein